MSRHPVLALSSLLLVGTLSACVTWRPVTVPPAQLLQEPHLVAIRISDSTGHRQVLTHPRLAGDSIVGKSPRAIRSRAVAVDGIRTIEATYSSPGRTAGRFLLAGVLTAALVFLTVAYLFNPGI